jgi:hypothetical protein
MFTNANKGRQEGEKLEVGDLVLLKREGIDFKVYDGTKERLRPLRIGPFRILELIGNLQFKIQLPTTLSRIHDVFHRERLYKYKEPTTDFPSRTHHEQPAMDPLTEEHEVERILDKRTHYRKQQYLVHWKGFGNDEREWMNEIDLGHCKDLVADFELSLTKPRGDVARTQDLGQGTRRNIARTPPTKATKSCGVR